MSRGSLESQERRCLRPRREGAGEGRMLYGERF
jgi:hypothetical protein